MKERRRLAVAGMALCTFPSFLLAQRRLWRIGYHSDGSAESNAGWLEAFRNGMTELGWSEAKHYVIDARYADGDSSRGPKIAAELVATQPDIILCTADGSILSLRGATRTIPIVFAIGADPVGNGYAASLQRPGGNATGLSALSPDLAAKRLQLLQEVSPQAGHVRALFEPLDMAAAPQMKGYEAAAAQAKIRLSIVEVHKPADIETAFGPDAPPPDAYLIVSSRMLNVHRKSVVERVLKARAPAISSNVIWAESGLLMTYAPSYSANFRRAAVYVDKILKGAKPGDLAIEQPTKFDLVINARTAKSLGLAIPPSVRLRADRIIE